MKVFRKTKEIFINTLIIFNLINMISGNAITDDRLRWTNGIIPYVIDQNLSGNTELINEAFQEYHNKTCIRFIKRTNQKNYIRIFSGEGCYSYIGMINMGAQDVSLGNGCMDKGTIIHNLGHTIGFFHEQNRSDRDDYIIIYYQNIQSGMESQFQKLAPQQNKLYNRFDYDSIMMYGNKAFSRDGYSNTMVARDGTPLKEPYDKKGLTFSDIQRIERLYECKRK